MLGESVENQQNKKRMKNSFPWFRRPIEFQKEPTAPGALRKRLFSFLKLRGSQPAALTHKEGAGLIFCPQMIFSRFDQFAINDNPRARGTHSVRRAVKNRY